MDLRKSSLSDSAAGVDDANFAVTSAVGVKNLGVKVMRRWGRRMELIIGGLIWVLLLSSCQPAPISIPIPKPSASDLDYGADMLIGVPLTTPNALAMEQRLIVIEAPGKIHVGDNGILRLSLIMAKDGENQPITEAGGEATNGKIEAGANLYDKYNVMVETRLEMAGLKIQPQGSLIQPMAPEMPLRFVWNLQPEHEGIFRGVLWMYLDLIPKEGGVQDQRALLAKPLEIQAVTVLGMSAPLARWIGGLGTLISLVLGFPFLKDAWLKFGKPKKPWKGSSNSA